MSVRGLRSLSEALHAARPARAVAASNQLDYNPVA